MPGQSTVCCCMSRAPLSVRMCGPHHRTISTKCLQVLTSGPCEVWLHDLPLWNSVCALATKDWARGSVVLFAFPLLPCLLVLSAVNERVRRLRGIQLDDVRQLGDAGPPRSILTSRVSKAMKSLSKWNWLSVIFWAYVWSYALLLYKLTPISLNILLARPGRVRGGAAQWGSL